MPETEQVTLDTSIFSSIGSGQTRVICSPFYPFNEKFCRSMVSMLGDSDCTWHLFSRKKRTYSDKAFRYPSLLDYYGKLLSDEGSADTVLLAFGSFTNLFLDLAVRYRARVRKVILMEPDYTDTLLSRLYDPAHRIFFKSRYMVNFFCKPPTSFPLRQYKSSLSGKALYRYYVSTTEEGINRKMLKTAMSHEIDIVIFWKSMIKESWPLAQILEDYRCTVHYIHNNILDSLLSPNSTTPGLLKDEIENKIPLKKS
jgi:pimeloyl-ACP methyl ester carboxylesterase